VISSNISLIIAMVALVITAIIAARFWLMFVQLTEDKMLS
jgi:hypothetical protein